ncbi:modification methylase [Streptomyces aurantiacus]|uniref:DNA methyltransferase n=1 Tax=Streptomyces aurantiacus TaxID=47760 RepID=UPI00279422F8|nr:DNA methyltransferase [Streptomyces aurantiacus]MDQ0772875.1 modification methylase [Streptomyces aurantiacus]
MTARFPQPFARPRPLISVWPTGQLDSHAQLADGRYVPETAQDAGRMPPAIAAHAITTYTRPGDTVLDPDCGAGTVLTEALRSGRHAIGLTSKPRWRYVARANIAAAKYDGATPNGMVLDHLPATAATRLSGRLSLVLMALRSTGSVHHSGQTPGDAAAPYDSVIRLCRRLTASRPLLCPGGHAIVTVQPRYRRGYLLDLAGLVWEAGEAAGLISIDRCVALLTELCGDRLFTQNSLAQQAFAGQHQRVTGHPTALTVHHDVFVFRAPAETAQITARSAPTVPAGSASRCRVQGQLDLHRERQVAKQRSAA